MKLKSLSNKDLQEKILWAQVDVRVREIEPRYEKQPEEERRKEYEELNSLYRKYWDEAFRRGLVEKSSEELENPTPEQ